MRNTTCNRCGCIKKNNICGCNNRIGGYIGTPKKQAGKETNTSRWQKLRTKVKKRDNGCCQRCWSQSKLTTAQLEAHHIVWISTDKDKELIFDIDNLVTLCRECHEDIHKGCKTGELDFDWSIYKDIEFNL